MMATVARGDHPNLDAAARGEGRDDGHYDRERDAYVVASASKPGVLYDVRAQGRRIAGRRLVIFDCGCRYEHSEAGGYRPKPGVVTCWHAAKLAAGLEKLGVIRLADDVRWEWALDADPLPAEPCPDCGGPLLLGVDDPAMRVVFMGGARRHAGC